MNTSRHSNFDSQRHLLFTGPAQIERDMHVLMGAISGIVCDQVINNIEKQQLEDWLNNMSLHIGREPYDSIIDTVRRALMDNLLTSEEKEDILWLCSKFVNEKPYYNLFTRDLQKLSGVIYGIVADTIINDQEIQYLDNWLEEHNHLQNCWPYDGLYNFLTHILSDGAITEQEKSELMSFLNVISDNGSETTENLIQLFSHNFYQIDPQIQILEQTFCITGLSKKFSRKQLAEAIIVRGGAVLDNVSGNINYLVVCAEKNQCWAYNSYGRKIEQAMKLRKAGKKIAIIHEFDLYDSLHS